VNYHLRAGSGGLVELVEERKKGNCIERVMRGVAASYVISPVCSRRSRRTGPVTGSVVGAVDARTGRRLVRDTGALISGAAKARKSLATFALDGEVRFASATDRAEFAEELTNTSRH